jgi:hypothetical protein
VMLVEDEVDDTHISCYGFPTTNRFSVPSVDPNGELVRTLLYRVPVDDATTRLYFVRFYPSDKPSFRTQIRESKAGEYKRLDADWWGIDVGDQDRMAIEQQGVIADRPNEHLGVSDGGIILMRRMMRESLEAVQQGKDPLCIIRDPAQQRIDFPQKSLLMKQKHDEPNYAGGWARETVAAK